MTNKRFVFVWGVTMKQWLLGGALFLGVCLLAGCSFGSIQDHVRENYPLYDAVESSANPNDTARIYVAENKSIDDVAEELIEIEEPNEIGSQQEGKRVLVYDDYFVILTEDEDNSNDTFIEVATYGFVRDNYHPSFFDGMFTYFLLSQLFDVDDWADRQRSRCAGDQCYKGYNASGGGYKGPVTTPGFRGASGRGGGPGAGK